jgi:signal transduction histidine kinase
MHSTSGQEFSSSDSLTAHMRKQPSDSLRLDALFAFVQAHDNRERNMHLLDSAQRWWDNTSGVHHHTLIQLNLTLSVNQYLHNDYRAAIRSVFRVRELATKALDTANLITANNNLNILYYRLSKYDSSLYYLNQNYELLKTSTDTFAIAGNLNGLGLYHLNNDAFERASRYFHNIHKLALQTSDQELRKRLLLLTYSNLGILHTHQDFPDSAAYYAHKHLTLKPDDASAMNTLGSVYKDRGLLDSALFYYKKVFDKARATEKMNLLSGSANNMAIVLNLKEKYRDALHYARTGKNKAAEMGRLEWVRVGLEEEVKALAGLGRHKEAFNLMDELEAVRDSLNGLEVRERMAELETTYDLKERTSELQLAQARNALQLAELEEEKFRNRFALAGLIVLLVVAGIIIFFYLRLRKTRTALAESNAVKDRFFAVVAHDLRGGFGGFSGIGPLIERMLDKEDYACIRKITAQLEGESLRLEKMLDSLLQWAFLQLDRINMHPIRLNLEEIFRERQEELDGMARKKDLNITTDWGAKAAFADKDAVVFILRNLLSNAIKFSHQGGKIRICSEEEGGKVAIHVKDEGMGMPEEVMSSIFKAGEKVTQTGTSGEKGNGLGLTLSREFAERNNGYIRVESQEGQGSDFIVYLPAA